jgi:predicted CoA-binding protein
MSLSDSELRALLAESRVIAVVGHSDKPHRDSYRIGHYLRQAGYRVYAVNPNISTVEGERAYPDLAHLPEPIDIVDVFRRALYLPELVDAAIAVRARAVWGQLGVAHSAAEARARVAGLTVVTNRCIMVEHQRLEIPFHA